MYIDGALPVYVHERTISVCHKHKILRQNSVTKVGGNFDYDISEISSLIYFTADTITTLNCLYFSPSLNISHVNVFLSKYNLIYPTKIVV